MTLTGQPDGVPAISPAPAFALLEEVTAQLSVVTRETGTAVRADPAELLAGRAALTGFTRQGQVSAGGSSRLLRCADGWCAVTLSSAADADAMSAVLGLLGLAMPASGLVGAGDDAPVAAAWAALGVAALGRSAAAVAAAAQVVGIPAAALPVTPLPPGEARRERPAAPPADFLPPWRATRIAAASPVARLAGALVVDLSSMWAGPLCARLLGLAGARVVKVETPDRPDGARAGNPEFFDWLQAGHDSVALDFRSASGHEALRALLAAADVVIEASRPRALEQLGLAPAQVPHRDGQVWLSITGYGRLAPNLVAFGDDAAVAGGLVGWVDSPGEAGQEPVFCADAVADPLTGACGALAVARALADGGGQLIDLPMREVAERFAVGRAIHPGNHAVYPGRPAGHPASHHGRLSESGADAFVRCDVSGVEQAVLPPARPVGRGRAAQLGADTAAVLDWLAAAPLSSLAQLPGEDLLALARSLSTVNPAAYRAWAAA
jgi:hypothetical protein